ncbi:hypothetical protein E2562_033161 [Oryza meyeriana var. granulata]|uniref:Uncharacterized protein n=1 Tax=Oryza meyeriana var. granulata TaxID=110450 RepID=A0A6G1DTP7_9ORYZ|nr:hypothetical protein E2562_033161 [Oryza meyeriana var. granulata]
MIFVSYEPDSKAYRAYDPVARRVHVSRDIVFDEAAEWSWGGEHDASGNTDFIIEYTSVFHPSVTSVMRSDSGEPSSPPSPKNKTWRLVDLPAGHRPIGLKWVYKLKKDAQGIVVKHKARLVAKGTYHSSGIAHLNQVATEPLLLHWKNSDKSRYPQFHH